MSDFYGYLVKFGNVVLPHSYIQYDTYKVVPFQRTELAAYRDNNNELHRTTSPSVHDQSRDQCMISHVNSACSVT